MMLMKPIHKIVAVVLGRGIIPRRWSRGIARLGARGIAGLWARLHHASPSASATAPEEVEIPVAATPQVAIWHCPTLPEAAHYLASTQGDKFHTPDCRWAAQISPDHRLCIRDREAAIRAGYTPCSTCQS